MVFFCNYRWQLVHSAQWWCLCPQCTVPREVPLILYEKQRHMQQFMGGKKIPFYSHRIFNQHGEKREMALFLFIEHQHAESHTPLKSVRATYLWMAFPPKGRASQAGRIGVHS